MRHGLANFLHALANRIYSAEHHDLVEIVDEYENCRCRLGIAADETHGVDSEFVQLPAGWEIHSRRED